MKMLIMIIVVIIIINLSGIRRQFVCGLMHIKHYEDAVFL